MKCFETWEIVAALICAAIIGVISFCLILYVLFNYINKDADTSGKELRFQSRFGKNDEI